LCTSTDNAEAKTGATLGQTTFDGACQCTDGSFKSGTSCVEYETCTAGQYRDESNTCQTCPNYKWSNAGAVGAAACKTIQLKIYYSYWDSGSNSACPYFVAKWLDAGSNVKLENSLFKTDIETGDKNFADASRTDGDPYYGKSKGGGQKCRHLWGEGHSMYLDCTSLPCTIKGTSDNACPDFGCTEGKRSYTYEFTDTMYVRLKPDS
jgi:hypothetical protein